MKKVLVSLLVLALAMTSVFAAVNFSGSLTAGYQFQWYQDKFTSHVQGQDGDDTNTAKINLSIADENGIWNVNLEGSPLVDDSGAIAGDITVDLLKSFGVESDFGLKVGFAANDEQTVQRAYHSVVGKNFDRIRTNAPGVWANATLTYGDLVTVTVAGAPALAAYKNGSATEKGDLMVSAIVKPYDGIAVSAGYVLNGKADDNFIAKMGGNGLVTGAVDVNIGALANLDFDLGVSVADKYAFEAAYTYDPGLGSDIVGAGTYAANLLSATVYGGVDVVDFGVEYGWQSVVKADAKTNLHFLAAKVNLNVVEGMLLDVYFGSWNLEKFADYMFVGGDIGYTLAGVTYKLGIEYSGAKSLAYDNAGFVVVPSISVAW